MTLNHRWSLGLAPLPVRSEWQGHSSLWLTPLPSVFIQGNEEIQDEGHGDSMVLEAFSQPQWSWDCIQAIFTRNSEASDIRWYQRSALWPAGHITLQKYHMVGWFGFLVCFFKPFFKHLQQFGSCVVRNIFPQAAMGMFVYFMHSWISTFHLARGDKCRCFCLKVWTN